MRELTSLGLRSIDYGSDELRHERCSFYLSLKQWLIVGFIFSVMMVIGKHDLTSSALKNRAMHMSGDELADSVESGSTVRRIVFIVLLCAGVLVMVRMHARGFRSSMFGNNVLLSGFMALAFLSSLWSSDPGLTARRSTEYLILCIGAAAAGRVLGMRGVVWLGFVGSTGYLLIGIVAEILLGTFFPLRPDYRFYGTLYPNEQAWNCVLLLVCGSALISGARRRWRSAMFTAMALGGICLFLTKSRTSLICGALALGFYWGGRLSLQRKLALCLAGMVVAAVCLGTILVDSSLASQLDRTVLAGRDAESYESFSGRIPLWQLCMGYVSARPLAGYGFDSFWTPAHIRTISEQEGWAVPAAHNGFIEILLGLGITGMALYLFQLGGTWRRLRALPQFRKEPLLRCYLSLLLFYFTCMFTEAIAFDVGLPTFCLLCLMWSRRDWLVATTASERSSFRPCTSESTLPPQPGGIAWGTDDLLPR